MCLSSSGGKSTSRNQGFYNITKRLRLSTLSHHFTQPPGELSMSMYSPDITKVGMDAFLKKAGESFLRCTFMWFGIELFLLLMLFYIVVGIALVAGITVLLIAVFKVKIKSGELVFIVLLFLVAFSVSSLFIRGKEDGVIEGFIGDPTRYEGSQLFYGFPAIWMRRFVPYDVNYRNMFFLPDNFYFIGFFVDFTFWLAISLVIVYSAKILSTKRSKKVDWKKSQFLLFCWLCLRYVWFG